MLSARPIAIQAVDPLLSDPSGMEALTISVAARGDTSATTPAILQANQLSNILTVESGQLLPPASKATISMAAVTSQSTLLFNTTQTTPDEPDALTSPAKGQSASGDINGQGSVFLNLGQNLLGNSLSPESNAGALVNLTNPGSGAALLGGGDLSTSLQGFGLNNFFPGQGNLLLNQNATANDLVSSGAGGLLVGGGVFLGQGTGSSISSLHLSGGGIIVTPVSLVNSLSAYSGTQGEPDGSGQNPFLSEADNPFQISPGWASSNQAAMHWLSANWTASAPEGRVGELVAYPQISFVQSVSPTISSASLAVPRLVSVGVGIGADRGPQIAAYPVGVAGEASSALLSGRETDWIEKPGSSGSLFARAAATSVTFDTSSAAANESTTRDPILVTDLIALGMDETARQAGVSATREHTPDLPANPATGRYLGPLASEILVGVPVVDSVSRFGLLQIDVTRGAPVPNSTSMQDSGGSTAAYLGGEQSSLWSLVTTYSLVILPRHRKPQPTILVVDPDDATRDAVNVALVREGYFVLPAASVRDAWGMLRTPHSRIDLVLMDPHLPDVSGIHLCARLREMSPTVPVMVCAGDVEPAEVDQLRQLGVRYYLRKPIAFEELLHTVRAILA